MRWARKIQPPGQLCQEGWAALRSRSRPDFGMFKWNFEIWTVVSGSNCKGSAADLGHRVQGPFPDGSPQRKALARGGHRGCVSLFFDTFNSLCLAPPLPTLGGLGAKKPELGGSGLVDCLANGGMGGPSVLSVTVKDTFTKLEIWLSFCPISICKSCPLILKLTQVCGLGPDFRHLLVVGNF